MFTVLFAVALFLLSVLSNNGLQRGLLHLAFHPLRRRVDSVATPASIAHFGTGIGRNQLVASSNRAFLQGLVVVHFVAVRPG